MTKMLWQLLFLSSASFTAAAPSISNSYSYSYSYSSSTSTSASTSASTFTGLRGNGQRQGQGQRHQVQGRQDQRLRQSQRQLKPLDRLFDTTCLLLLEVIEFKHQEQEQNAHHDAHHDALYSDTQWVCQLDTNTNSNPLGLELGPHATVRIDHLQGLIESRTNEKRTLASIVSGESVLSISETFVVDLDLHDLDNGNGNGGLPLLRATEDATVELRPVQPLTATATSTSTSAKAAGSSRAKGPGAYTGLVVRIVDPDGKGPAQSLEEIQKKIFGSNNDTESEPSLQSQLADCSYNQFTLDPFEGSTGNNVEIQHGAVEIQLDDFAMYDDIFQAQTATLSKLGAIQYDFVLYCLPPGGSMRGQRDWIGVARINGKASYYNGDCSSLSVLLHEFGHNLGLGHSGIKYNGYGDRQGFMGFLGSDRKCYNPAKSYNLGWYSKQVESINPLDNDSRNNDSNEYNPVRTVVLNGVSDYGQNLDALIILRLEQPSTHIHGDGTKHRDYYIGYNRKDGINAGTDMDGDRVTIVRKEAAAGVYGASTMLASLEVGESYQFHNFDSQKHRTVEVSFVRREHGLRDAVVEIRDVANLPPTQAPTEAPITNQNENNGIDSGKCEDRSGAFRWSNKKGKPTKKKRTCKWIAMKGRCHKKILIDLTADDSSNNSNSDSDSGMQKTSLWKQCPESCQRCG